MQFQVGPLIFLDTIVNASLILLIKHHRQPLLTLFLGSWQSRLFPTSLHTYYTLQIKQRERERVFIMFIPHTRARISEWKIYSLLHKHKTSQNKVGVKIKP